MSATLGFPRRYCAHLSHSSGPAQQLVQLPRRTVYRYISHHLVSVMRREEAQRAGVLEVEGGSLAGGTSAPRRAAPHASRQAARLPSQRCTLWLVILSQLRVVHGTVSQHTYRLPHLFTLYLKTNKSTIPTSQSWTALARTSRASATT